MITLRQPKIRGKADPSEEELHPRSRWRLGSSSLAKSWKAVEWWCNSYSFPTLKRFIYTYIYIYIMVYINRGGSFAQNDFFPIFFGGDWPDFNIYIYLIHNIDSHHMTWHEFFQLFLSSCPAGDLIKGGDWPQGDGEMMMTCFFREDFLWKNRDPTVDGSDPERPPFGCIKPL